MKPGKPVLALTTILIATLLWIPISLAAPNEMNFQGRLTDLDGNEVADGFYIMEFLIYDSDTGGSYLWWELQEIYVQNSIYNAILGRGTTYHGTLDAALFSGDDRWFEVRVNGFDFSPRQKLTSVAYALQAASVANNVITTDMLQAQSITVDKIADDTVTGDKIADNSISNLDINDGPSSGLDADTVDGAQAVDLEESAEIDADITVHAGISNAHHSKTISFSELTDSATDDQIPNDITIDQAANADTLDGNHASDFSPSSHAHSSLNASDGSPVDAVYVNNAGRVGIGTTSPSEELHIAGNNPRVLIEDTATSNPEVNLRSPGTGDWAIYKEHNSGDLRFYNNGEKIAIEAGTGNVGIGTITPISGHKLHVNGLAMFELGSGRIALSTPGSWPGFIAWHSDGSRSDIVFNNDGMYLSKSEDSSMPSANNGLMIRESGKVGIGISDPAAKLEVRGEVRTTSDSGASRLWGQGRPGAKRWGVSGEESGLCTNGQVKFGLSHVAVQWGNADAACPAGTWVCTSEERGREPCDTQRPDDFIFANGLDCDGSDLFGLIPDQQWGWLADAPEYLPHTEGWLVKEDGDLDGRKVCVSIPVWCCSN